MREGLAHLKAFVGTDSSYSCSLAAAVACEVSTSSTFIMAQQQAARLNLSEVYNLNVVEHISKQLKSAGTGLDPETAVVPSPGCFSDISALLRAKVIVVMEF